MPAYYLHVDDGDDSEFEASSDSEALRIAAERIRAEYEPEDTTYWAHATLLDEHEETVADWYEEIEPRAPDCDPPLTDLGWASVEELERIWGVDAYEEDGHVWGRPYSLLGGSPDNPGVRGSVTETACLRCGMSWALDADATDPKTGARGVKVVCEPNYYAVEVKEAWYTAHGLAEPEPEPAY